MNIGDMETLIESFGIKYDELDHFQETVQREFADAVRALR